MSWPPEIRPSDDGTFDELVVRDVDVHFEMMDEGNLWVGISKRGRGAKAWVVWVEAKGKKLMVTTRDDS